MGPTINTITKSQGSGTLGQGTREIYRNLILDYMFRNASDTWKGLIKYILLLFNYYPETCKQLVDKE